VTAVESHPVDHAAPGAAPAAPGTGWIEAYMGGSQEAEVAMFARVLPQVEHIQETVARKQGTPVRRAFHNKGTVVAIRFDVAPDLPEPLRVGFLVPGASYEGFGRFSRSQSFRLRDRDRDQRGFAFRITTHRGAQDILLSNTPGSFARDPVQFMRVATIFAESSLVVAPIRVLLATGLREGIRIVRNLLAAPDRTVSFTSQRYWSRTPFELGEAAVRLFVRPSVEPRRVDRPDDDDFLATDLAAELRAGPATFELCAQLFVNEGVTPIEDSSKEWPEAVAPPVVLGTVTVLPQDLDGPAASHLAARVEALEAFNPIVTQDLRPLGRMNRARVLAYVRSADHRRTGPRE
jgi:hypothetical protein